MQAIFEKENVPDTDRSHVQTISQPSALLDLRFHPSPGKQDVCAVVSSTGTLAIFKLDPTNPDAPLQHVATSRCEDLAEDVLFLQCNWHPNDSQIIGVTTSTGLSRLLRLDQAWEIAAAVDLDIENSLEAWSIAFAPEPASDAPPGSTTVYCGGDDSILRYNSYVVTSSNHELPSAESCFSPISIKGQHDAGVTAILPLGLHEPSGGRLVLTGSYDDHVRLFAIHDPQESYGMRRVQLLTDRNLDGGVWRLDLVDTTSSANSLEIRILASCMYAGARLIRLRMGTEEIWSCEVLARFEEHKSMNYASAIVPRKQGDERLECISTSFYDKLLCLWEYISPNPIE